MNTEIASSIKKANQILMEYWPLNTFIATNPLWGARNRDFFDVVSNPRIEGLMNIEYYHSHYQAGRISDQDLLQSIESIEKKILSNAELIQWIEEPSNQIAASATDLLFAGQIDEYQYQCPTIWIKNQIFSLMRDYFGLGHYKQITLVCFWHTQNNIKNAEIDNIGLLPIEKSIDFLLTKLNVPDAVIADYLETIYLQIYGWSSLMNWRNAHPNNPWLPGHDACELILLMWLAYEYIISINKNITYQSNASTASIIEQKNCFRKRYIWQTAFEGNYLSRLKSKLNINFSTQKKYYDAQFIFCIDTRSEGFRRHIEEQGNYQTFGFAGFFGAIFNLNNDGIISYQAPALAEATHTLTVKKQPAKLKIWTANLKKTLASAKKQFIAPFVLFEALGFWFLFFMIYKMIQPKFKIKAKSTKLKISISQSEDEQFQSAYNLLISIGLVDYFSSHIFICAHESNHVNNPFKSSLNCGACGGNSGIPNAIVMCEILNKTEIRLKLKEVQINIPPETQFIPSCHHTTFDRLEILKGEVPKDLQNAINCAAENLRQEKTKDLPGCSSLLEREHSWSELIPELGLINNTAIIIGPRELTLHQDLERRIFLHSYSPNLDENADILTNILSAPAIVAHWINSQYYFSTVNPDIFGAGNKAIHNVLPGVGVIQGNLSDLKIGLPLQSTHFQSEKIHEPRRIAVIVYAHKKTLDKAVENSSQFKALLDNNWIYLKHIEAK